MSETAATQTSIEPFPDARPEQTETARNPDAASLRFRLRAETRAAHERLDASFPRLAEGERGDYGLFLRVNEACHRVVEPLLANAPLAGLPPAETRARHAAARADLEAMGLRPIAPAPFPVPNPSLAQSVGIAYVVEGSRLGARLILKALRRRDGPAATDRPFPTLFLEAAGGPEHFRSFLALADTLVSTRSGRDAAVDAAGATFDYFQDAVRRACAAGDCFGGAT